MMISVVVLLITTMEICAADDGWIAVQRDVAINYDLEKSPLQIRTNSVVGSNERVYVLFYTAGGDAAGGVSFNSRSPPLYYLYHCMPSRTNFPTALPTETDLIWTLTLSRTSGTVSMIIHCNNKEVLNVVLPDTTCSGSGWSESWSRKVEKIKFCSEDSASDYYRPGWIAIQRKTWIDYDLENSPLQIKTNSEVGSNEQVSLSFWGSGFAGGVSFSFTSPPKYQLTKCNTSWTNFSVDLPHETDKIWTIALSRTTGKRQLIIHCNDTEVVNVVVSDKTCNESDWVTTWGIDVTEIQFLSGLDTASDYYRPAPDCTGLKREWTSTIETTTQFPVKPGTVVEVTCTEADAVNEGDSEVTCIGATFAFSEAPICTIPDCTGLKITWTNMKAGIQFPVSTGTVLSLSCNGGHGLKGDETVTCTTNTDFQFSVEPTCEPCPTGQYKSADMTKCEVCEEGSISSTTGATSCTTCDPGQEANSDKTQCEPCPAGQYKSADMTTCEVCEEGSISSTTGATSCKTCDPGQEPNSDKTQCVDCSAGTYRDDRFTVCTKCAENSMAEQTGAAFCRPCSAGTVSNEERTQCVECSAGTYRDSTVTICTKCAANSMAEQTGAASCTSCSAGTVSNEERTQCVECSAGTYRDSTVTICTNCPENWITEQTGAASCTSCSAGTVSNEERTQCVECSAGTYRDDRFTVCTKCAENSISEQTGAASCTSCSAGTVSNEERTQCVGCSAGTYRDSTVTICTKCAANSIAKQTGAASCTSCSAGTISNEERILCDPCEEGTYRNSSMSDCQKCLDGTISKEGAGSCKCPPPSVDKATFSPSGDVPVNAAVTVTCNKPKRYLLIGEKYVTCQSTGWTNTPECKKCGVINTTVGITVSLLSQRTRNSRAISFSWRLKGVRTNDHQELCFKNSTIRIYK